MAHPLGQQSQRRIRSAGERRFEDGVGTFYGSDQHAGRPVRVRFLWSHSSANSAHWQQAFSVDGGASWETNWHMWFRRLDAQGRLRHDDAVRSCASTRCSPAAATH
jgi:hypothetical protein